MITPLLLSENAAAQDVNIHPSDLFETPQEGIETALPRSSRDSDSWKDYTHLSLNASVSGESNVFLDNSENEQSDTIFTIAPTLSFTTPGLGSEDRKLSIYYTPSYRIYSNNSDLNGLDHTYADATRRRAHACTQQRFHADSTRRRAHACTQQRSHADSTRRRAHACTQQRFHADSTQMPYWHWLTVASSWCTPNVRCPAVGK